MPYFNIVAQTNENTVVARYEFSQRKSDSYQSEAELEKEFISLLTEQGYEYLQIHTEEDMVINLRKKLEELNDYRFSDTEWERFFKDCIANSNDGVVEKTRKIQEDNVQVLKRDDNMTKNITLIDRKNIHNNKLQVINQYVVTATERILNRIEIAHNYHKQGDIAAGGYIWHTTGSGKTLTSFKTARLASSLPYIDKVLFVVDRKDLDYQTMKEYDRFEKGAANSNSSTAILERQLRGTKEKIIITTIQKLSSFIKKFREHPVYNKQVVIIFDECHRSQFGDMHAAIVSNFKKYYMFGFTGTPIFPANAGSVRNPKFFTTEQTFGDQLHSYTIVDAINDKNVLPFKVEYHKTMEMEPDIDDEQVRDIDRKKAFEAPERISLIAKYILEHFDQKTYRGDKSYVYNTLTNISEVASADRGKVEEIKQKQRLSGFNSIFAVSSVEMAKAYYEEFRKQIKNDPTKDLKIAVIYSYGANEEEQDGILNEENPEDTSALDQTARDFLDGAINDYNMMFHTNYDTSSDKFQNYYKDVSLRMKNKELDMLIVVNMFLTGFDATTLNTLWVDKNLKMHGLIQAFSRTNRILNSIKTFGNVVCFRNLQKRVDAAISLFGDKNAGGIVLMQSFKDYYSWRMHFGRVKLRR